MSLPSSCRRPPPSSPAPPSWWMAARPSTERASPSGQQLQAALTDARRQHAAEEAQHARQLDGEAEQLRLDLDGAPDPLAQRRDLEQDRVVAPFLLDRSDIGRDLGADAAEAALEPRLGFGLGRAVLDDDDKGTGHLARSTPGAAVPRQPTASASASGSERKIARV